MGRMTRDDLNRAIARLRRLNKNAAGEAAWAYAVRMLPVAAKYRTPADLAALLVVALALYHTAVVRISEDRAFGTFVETLNREQRALSAAGASEVFSGCSFYPQKLQQYRQVLLDSPPLLLQSAFEIAMHGTNALRASRQARL